MLSEMKKPMSKKLTSELKKAGERRIAEAINRTRTVLNLCVTKKDLGVRVRGIQI